MNPRRQGSGAPLCSVVVLNWNGRDLLSQFLPSIVGLCYPNKEIIVVDNASNDGSVELLAQQFPDVRVVQNEDNYGTAEGSNIGARHARGEYIFWISNDMEVEPAMLDSMIETAESDSTIGICTCKMRRYDMETGPSEVLDSVGGDIDLFGFPYARGIGEIDRGQWDASREVFFSFGGAMLIKRRVLEHIGGYDPDYFTLADDIDLSWRVRLAGYQVVVDPRAVLYHRGSATLGTLFGRSRKRFWSERNTLRTLLKNYSATSLAWILPGYVTLLLMEMAFFAVIRKWPLVAAVARAAVWNLRRLRDTARMRARVQRLRVVGDDEIRRLMIRRSLKLDIFADYLKHGRSPEWRAYFGEMPTEGRASVRSTTRI